MRRAAAFDLDAFRRALTDRDIDYRLSRYAPDADIRIVDPDNPPAAPLLIHGTDAIRVWLRDSEANDLDPEVTRVVDGGDRVAFTERWHHGGTAVLATSTAELADGLITMQHTILAWGEADSEWSAWAGISNIIEQPVLTVRLDSDPTRRRLQAPTLYPRAQQAQSA